MYVCMYVCMYVKREKKREREIYNLVSSGMFLLLYLLFDLCNLDYLCLACWNEFFSFHCIYVYCPALIFIECVLIRTIEFCFIYLINDR